MLIYALIDLHKVSKNGEQPGYVFYVCGEFTVPAQRHSLTPLVKMAYEQYFGCKVGDQDKLWVPHICCGACTTRLRKWLQGSRPSMSFAVPKIWRELNDHFTH